MMQHTMQPLFSGIFYSIFISLGVVSYRLIKLTCHKQLCLSGFSSRFAVMITNIWMTMTNMWRWSPTYAILLLRTKLRCMHIIDLNLKAYFSYSSDPLITSGIANLIQNTFGVKKARPSKVESYLEVNTWADWRQQDLISECGQGLAYWTQALH